MYDPDPRQDVTHPSKSSRRFGAVFAMLASLSVLCWALLAAPPSASARTDAHVRHAAPAFTLATRSGSISLDSLRGRVVLIDFWASWCGPCRHSFPWLASMHERYASRGLTIVAINLDKRRDLADAFLGEFKPPFQVAFDPSGETAEAFKVSAMPSSVLIGPDGKILYTHAGFDPKKTGPLETQIKDACPQ